MKKDKNNKLAKGILAGGATLSLVALRELLLSKEEHDKKEKEIKKIEKTKDKYLKQIGEYEPFDIKKGRVTPNDGKLVNILTRAVGVAFSNDDIFTRNKSNVRTFPFIITNNSSVTAAMEVELRKYYEVLVAAQIANLINSTVFSAENIINVNDKDRRTVDKVLDRILNQRLSPEDLGNNLQRGLYEKVFYDSDGTVKIINEMNGIFQDFQDYENAYTQVIRNFSRDDRQRQRMAEDLGKITEKRTAALEYKKSILPSYVDANGELKLAQGVTNATLNPQAQKIKKAIEEIINNKHVSQFDGIEPINILNDVSTLVAGLGRYLNSFEDGADMQTNVINYLTISKDYSNLMSRGLSVINNNNWTDPSKEMLEADPYYKLLGLNAVSDYSKASDITMRMFKNSNTLRIKLELAAALLISTEILPPEFIEYVTKYLGLPMTEDTKMQIALKYGSGDSRNPFVFMGNEYVIANMTEKQVLKFVGEIKPTSIGEREELLKNLSMKQLSNRVPGIWNVFRSRKALEKRWMDKFANVDAAIAKGIEALYATGEKLNKKELRQIISQDKSKFNRFLTSLVPNFLRNKNALINKMVDKQIDKLTDSETALKNKVTTTTASNRGDGMFAKSLSMMGANGARVHKIIENRLKNKIVDLSATQDIDKSLEYFLEPTSRVEGYDPRSAFMPNLQQAQDLMKMMLNEGFEEELITTVLTEELITDITSTVLEESYVYQNITTPVRTVTYKEVEKDPIEYVLPNYTKGKALLYGSAEIDTDQFKNRRVGEPIWIKVTFSDKINSMKVDTVDNDYTTTIGVKSEVHRVPEKDLMAVLKDPNRNVSGLSAIFQAQRDQTLGLLSKIANENDLKAANLNGILVASLNEATSAISNKPSEDYINNPSLAVRLKKRYNLTAMVLADPIAEEYYFMEENASSWSRMPFSELRSGANSSELKLLASMMGSRR